MLQRKIVIASIAWKLAFGSVAVAAPPPPYLVRNVNPGASSSQAFPLGDVNGTLFFSASRDEFGKELWKSDGTKQGTVMVKDIYPGTASVQDGIPYGYWSTPNQLTNVAGTLFFTAETAAEGVELWKSDGTEAGTVLVKELVPGPDDYPYPYDLVAAGNLLFFTLGHHLYVSDGTDAGTVRLTGLVVGVPPYSGFDPVAVGTTVYFAAEDIYTGRHRELWKTDGTVAGTSLLKTFGASADIVIDYASGAFGSLLLFTACDPTCQLWRTDGTGPGTFALAGVGASSVVDAGPLAFFTAYEGVTGTEVWKTDGTVLGTSLVTELVPGTGSPAINDLALVAFGGNVYFTVSELLSPGLGGLWRSDGTAGGTSRIAAFEVDEYALQDGLVNADGTLLFRTQTPDDRVYLWRSDGTPSGTEEVAEIFGRYLTYRFTAVGGALFFVPFAGDRYGAEPFIYLASCGNGAVGTGEQCDNGAMNGLDGICTTACIKVNDIDDDGVLNAADNCPTGWNPGQEDDDGDGEGDACEACVGGAAATKGQLKLGKLHTMLADDTLTLKGIVTVPTTPYIAPDLKGAIVRIEDSVGTPILDAEIPAFEYDPLYLDGWKTNSSYTSFTYANKNPGGLLGITKVGIKADLDTGIVKFSVKGKNGSFVVDPMNLPLTGILALDTEKPVVGQCGLATFPNPPGTPGSCTLKPDASSIQCK